MTDTLPSQEHHDDYKSKEINENQDKETTEKQTMGAFDGIIFLVAYVVGVGIFTTVGNVHVNAVYFWHTTFLWIASGIICFFGALW